MANRVVITGMGVVSPIGNDVETFWNSLKENKRGFGEITYFDTTDYKVKLAAQVKDFDPKQYMDPKTARRMEPFPSSQWLRQDRPWLSPASTWRRRIPSA